MFFTFGSFIADYFVFDLFIVGSRTIANNSICPLQFNFEVGTCSCLFGNCITCPCLSNVLFQSYCKVTDNTGGMNKNWRQT